MCGFFQQLDGTARELDPHRPSGLAFSLEWLVLNLQKVNVKKVTTPFRSNKFIDRPNHRHTYLNMSKLY